MKPAIPALLTSFFLVAACGGGGSDNGGNGGNPPPAGFDITPGNGTQVAGVVYQAAVASGDIANLAGGSGLTGSAGGGLAKPGFAQPVGGQLGAIVQAVPFGPTTVPCAVSGFLTISGDLANPLTLSAGDTILADYDNCDDGIGEVIDGMLDFEVDAFTGDILLGSYDMTMTMDIMNFQVTTAVDVVTGNGDGTARLNTLAAPYVEASVSGNSMTTDTNNSSETLSVYASAQTVDAGVSPSPFTMTSSGTLDSSDLEGAVQYSTPVMFEGFDSNYPVAGELLVTGADSSARLIAESNGIDVTIEIDSNGDGTVDETIMTTWAELAAM